jgi:hypothetical protein
MLAHFLKVEVQGVLFVLRYFTRSTFRYIYDYIYFACYYNMYVEVH